jgi:2-polyprenyl-6-methoxyphenol hydroxylase-like FAD-dependent oxidoreductase
MFGRDHVEVLVAGAGPVGLTLALLMAQRGIGVQIIDREWRTGAHSYGLAIHPTSIRLLDRMGLLAQALEQGRRIDTIGLYDQSGPRAQLRLDELGDVPYLLVLRQDVLERLLEERLAGHKVHVRWGEGISGMEAHEDSISATIDQWSRESGGYAVSAGEWIIERTHHTDARFIVGADGHASTVRRLLEIPFDPMGEVEYFAVFEFATSADLGSEMRIVLDDNNTSVLWPLPGGHCRWSFQLRALMIDEESRTKSRMAVQLGQQTYPFLTPEYLRALLVRRAPWFKGDIGQIGWSMAVRFERRLARQFGRGRCWLAGDAAHTAAPGGVQSMNVGLLEADDLAGRIAGILRDGAGTDLLREYNEQWLAEWRRLLGVESHASSLPHTEPWIAQKADRIIASIPATGENQAKLLRQIGLAVEPVV